jgi:hypothetical protein
VSVPPPPAQRPPVVSSELLCPAAWRATRQPAMDPFVVALLDRKQKTQPNAQCYSPANAPCRCAPPRPVGLPAAAPRRSAHASSRVRDAPASRAPAPRALLRTQMASRRRRPGPPDSTGSGIGRGGRPRRRRRWSNADEKHARLLSATAGPFAVMPCLALPRRRASARAAHASLPLAAARARARGPSHATVGGPAAGGSAPPGS